MRTSNEERKDSELNIAPSRGMYLIYLFRPSAISRQDSFLASFPTTYIMESPAQATKANPRPGKLPKLPSSRITPNAITTNQHDVNVANLDWKRRNSHQYLTAIFGTL